MPLDHDAIKRRRLELTLTMEEAAKRAGLASRQKWNDLENGRGLNPTLATLELIAAALNCSIADLVTDPQKPAKKRAK